MNKYAPIPPKRRQKIINHFINGGGIAEAKRLFGHSKQTLANIRDEAIGPPETTPNIQSPTQEEIQIACAQIQAGWSKAEKQKRQAHKQPPLEFPTYNLNLTGTTGRASFTVA